MFLVSRIKPYMVLDSLNPRNVSARLLPVEIKIGNYHQQMCDFCCIFAPDFEKTNLTTLGRPSGDPRASVGRESGSY